MGVNKTKLENQMPEISSTPKISLEQQSIVDRLIQVQQESRNAKGKPKSDEAFGQLIGMSGSKWNMIRNGTYWDKVDDLPSLFIDLKIALNKLLVRSMLTSRFGSKDFIEFTKFSAMFSAVQECQRKPINDPIRFNVFIGETGFGKSSLCAELMRRFENVIVAETRDQWGRSKYNALMDICAAAGIDTHSVTNPNDLEDALLTLFQSDLWILVIDEAEALGQGILNSLKLFLNRSRVVIVVCSIRESYQRWSKRFKHEANQLKSRTHVVIINNIITTDEAAQFLDKFSLQSPRESATLLAKAGTAFGGFRMIKRTVAQLDQSTTVTLRDIETAIAVSTANMGGN
jgi:hypothetical protein